MFQPIPVSVPIVSSSSDNVSKRGPRVIVGPRFLFDAITNREIARLGLVGFNALCSTKVFMTVSTSAVMSSFVFPSGGIQIRSASHAFSGIALISQFSVALPFSSSAISRCKIWNGVS